MATRAHQLHKGVDPKITHLCGVLAFAIFTFSPGWHISHAVYKLLYNRYNTKTAVTNSSYTTEKKHQQQHPHTNRSYLAFVCSSAVFFLTQAGHPCSTLLGSSSKKKKTRLRNRPVP